MKSLVAFLDGPRDGISAGGAGVTGVVFGVGWRDERSSVIIELGRRGWPGAGDAEIGATIDTAVVGWLAAASEDQVRRWNIWGRGYRINLAADLVSNRGRPVWLLGGAPRGADAAAQGRPSTKGTTSRRVQPPAAPVSPWEDSGTDGGAGDRPSDQEEAYDSLFDQDEDGEFLPSVRAVAPPGRIPAFTLALPRPGVPAPARSEIHPAPELAEPTPTGMASVPGPAAQQRSGLPPAGPRAYAELGDHTDLPWTSPGLLAEVSFTRATGHDFLVPQLVERLFSAIEQLPNEPSVGQVWQHIANGEQFKKELALSELERLRSIYIDSGRWNWAVGTAPDTAGFTVGQLREAVTKWRKENMHSKPGPNATQILRDGNVFPLGHLVARIAVGVPITRAMNNILAPTTWIDKNANVSSTHVRWSVQNIIDALTIWAKDHPGKMPQYSDGVPLRVNDANVIFPGYVLRKILDGGRPVGPRIFAAMLKLDLNTDRVRKTGGKMARTQRTDRHKMAALQIWVRDHPNVMPQFSYSEITVTVDDEDVIVPTYDLWNIFNGKAKVGPALHNAMLETGLDMSLVEILKKQINILWTDLDKIAALRVWILKNPGIMPKGNSKITILKDGQEAHMGGNILRKLFDGKVKYGPELLAAMLETKLEIKKIGPVSKKSNDDRWPDQE
ncbi:MAG TPA: hypothetical protein VHR86_09370, partial [Armatimonadota bacterium]|nr:hypothetical protein [Armatimonadota bacterium]